jgi:sugar lactone lactonase YvrE
MALDSLGNLYVCDGFSVVWKVDSSAHATIFAGTLFGIGYGGDGLPATQAALFFPTGVAVDSAGNVYIADWLNDRIRKVDTNGIITTVAGNGSQFFSGDGGPATSASLGLPTDVAVDAAGNIYTADWINFRIRVVDSAGIIQTFAGSGLFAYNGERLPASQTNMFPIGVAVSPSGQVYFADFGSYRVRKIEK